MALTQAPDVDAVAEAVSACPSVARLTPGSGVELVTYLPGRRVAGVRMGDDGLEVHVVARYGPTMAEVAEEIRAALRPVVGDVAISVTIHDIDVGTLDRKGTGAS